jgi:chromosomal replication initiator protein
MDRSNLRELWEYILSQVELSISPANFKTWFTDSHIIKVEEGIIYIGVPSQFFRDWYIKKFHQLLLKIVRGLSYEYRNIEYQIVKDERRKQLREPQRPVRPTIELPLNEFYIDKSDNLNPRYTFDSFVGGFL